MFGLGFSHLLLLGILGLIFIGPEELPQVARTIGRFLNEIKRGGESFRNDLTSTIDVKPPPQQKPAQPAEPVQSGAVADESEKPKDPAG